MNFVHLWLNFFPRPVFTHKCGVDFIVKVTNVAHHRAFFQRFEHAGITDIGVTCSGDDQVDFALRHGATAVHVGKLDMPVPEVWDHVEAQLSADRCFYVGATANTFEDIRRAVEAKASYIGLGPYRFTETKKNLSPILGLEGYRRIVGQCREAGWNIPIFAIGGIEQQDVKQLMQTGIDGIAVSGAILGAVSLSDATRRLIETIQTYQA